jgi:hypothetical protein
MGFFRQQEEKLAVRLLLWQYERMKCPAPPQSQVAEQASKLVGEAHRIARERGRNVISILKELIHDLRT